MQINVVDHLVSIFGSQYAVAKIAESSQSSVADWKRDNRVPSKRIEIMLANAPDKLKPADFFPAFNDDEISPPPDQPKAGAA